MSKKIRLWTLGKISDNPITPEVINRLKDIINGNTNGGTVELVWGPASSIEEIDKDVDVIDLLTPPKNYEFLPYVRPDYGRIPEDKL